MQERVIYAVPSHEPVLNISGLRNVLLKRILWHVVHSPRPAQIWRHWLTRKQTSQQVATVKVRMRSSYWTHYLSSAVPLQLINFGQNLYEHSSIVLKPCLHIVFVSEHKLTSIIAYKNLTNDWFVWSICLTVQKTSSPFGDIVVNFSVSSSDLASQMACFPMCMWHL